jgi:hypothetical protein
LHKRTRRQACPAQSVRGVVQRPIAAPVSGSKSCIAPAV